MSIFRDGKNIFLQDLTSVYPISSDFTLNDHIWRKKFSNSQIYKTQINK